MAAYYNEHDPYAAEWLRNLISEGLIADGDVDERDIWDVYPSDVRGYTQCHFFAGLGGWSYALRLAGVPDDRPVWTGSAPCQPFSAAGKGLSFADERHLWPAFFHLIEQCRPAIVMGEQVASKDGLAWLDLVSDDLQGAGYASRAVDTCAASVGAPHIRQRLYWVADSAGFRRQRLHTVTGCDGKGDGRSRDRGEKRRASVESQGACDVVRMDHPDRKGSQAHEAARPTQGRDAERAGDLGGLADAGHGPGLGSESRSVERGLPEAAGEDDTVRPGPTNGFWSDADWLGCRDGKWRPVEPGAFPLAHGVSGRVGRLRAYGNAIVPQVAAEFIRAVING